MLSPVLLTSAFAEDDNCNCLCDSDRTRKALRIVQMVPDHLLFHGKWIAPFRLSLLIQLRNMMSRTPARSRDVTTAEVVSELNVIIVTGAALLDAAVATVMERLLVTLMGKDKRKIVMNAVVVVEWTVTSVIAETRNAEEEE